MRLRGWLAGRVLSAIVSGGAKPDECLLFARTACRAADAMVAARDEEPSE